MTLTDAQLTRLRQRPHRTRVYLGIYKPNTIAALKVNESGISKGEREITVTTLGGDLADIERGMTAYIGTSQEGKDKGRLRAISGAGGVVTLAENDFDWKDGWFITVVDFREPWAVFPRITVDNNIATFYKDYDLEYTDEHENWRPVVVMGGNVAGFKITGSAGIWFSSTGTFVPDGDISTYAWEFEGSISTGSSDPDPGFIQYDTPGYYTAKLTVTSTLGKTFTGTRHVLIYDAPGEGSSLPITQWGFKNLQGSRETGGYNLTIWVREAASMDDIVDGALVVLFTEDWEGGVAAKEAAGTKNRNHILFAGYIQDNSIQKSWVDDSVEFNASSITGRMKALSTYSASLESKTHAATWNEVVDMTVDKAVISFLQSQSTILKISDFFQTGDAKAVQYADFARGNLFNSAGEFLNSTIFAEMVSNRQGQIYTEVNASLIPTGSRDFETSIHVTAQDWRDEIKIKERQTRPLAYIELGGIAYGGPATGTFTPLLTSAPGDPADYFGGVRRQQGLVLTGQTHLNELAALFWNKSNSRFQRVSMPMAGDYRIIDIAPQERVTLTLAESDTNRGLVWSQKKFNPFEINYDYRAQDEYLSMVVDMAEETEGVAVTAGRTIVVPEDPAYDNQFSFGWEFPDFPPLPDLPPLPGLGGEPEPPPLIESLIIACFDNEEIAKTYTFWEDEPEWSIVNTEDLPANYNAIRVNPFNQEQAFAIFEKEVWVTYNFLDPGSGTVWVQQMSEAFIESKLNGDGQPGFGLNRVEDVQFHPEVNGMVLLYASVSGIFVSKAQVMKSSSAGVLWEEAENVAADGAPGNEPASYGRGFIQFGAGGRVYVSIPGGQLDDNFLYWSNNYGEQYEPAGVNLGSGDGGLRDIVSIDGYDTIAGAFELRQTNNNYLYYSTDLMESVVLDGTFLFGSDKYATITGGQNDVFRPYRKHPVNDTIFAILQENTNSFNDTVFVVSGDGGITWSLRNYFIDEDLWEGTVTGLAINKGNLDRFYAYRKDSDGKFRPIGSLDGGFTWLDKLGNMDDILADSGSRGQAISPIKVIYYGISG